MHSGNVLVAAMVVGTLAASGCSTDEPGASPRDASVEQGMHDAAPEARADAPDAGCSNAIEATSICCSETLVDYCKAEGCLPAWPSDPTAFCTPCCGMPFMKECDGYRVYRENGTDMSWMWFYSSSSGALVAAVESNGNSMTKFCAGPATFDLPACMQDYSDWTSIDCDGGTAGSGGDGGIDGPDGVAGAGG